MSLRQGTSQDTLERIRLRAGLGRHCQDEAAGEREVWSLLPKLLHPQKRSRMDSWMNGTGVVHVGQETVARTLFVCSTETEGGGAGGGVLIVSY